MSFIDWFVAGILLLMDGLAICFIVNTTRSYVKELERLEKRREPIESICKIVSARQNKNVESH